MRKYLTFDLYLRENVKNRPGFAGDYSVGKEELYDLYDEVLSKNSIFIRVCEKEYAQDGPH